MEFCWARLCLASEATSELLPALCQGDPSAVPAIVENVKQLLGAKPMFGICMGHQILGQAVGGSTFKLKFGHHGGNHPIRYDATGKSRRVPRAHPGADRFGALSVFHITVDRGEGIAKV